MNTELAAALQDVDALLEPDVYDALFNAVAAHAPSTVLEIGTAHGGATIAMALAGKAARADFRVHTVDTLEMLPGIPSSRAKYGDTDANKAIVLENFRRAGVDEHVSLFVGRSDDYAAAGDVPGQIDMLVLDADGRIDRDLLYFHHLLQDDAPVVIDDVKGQPKLIRVMDESLIDLKHVIGAKLLAGLLAAGYLVQDKMVGETAFCRAVNPKSWDKAVLNDMALAAYRELVFTPMPTSAASKAILAGYLKRSAFGRGALAALRKSAKVIRGT